MAHPTSTEQLSDKPAPGYEKALLALIEQLASELQQLQLQPRQISLNSSLDKDLGFDSLALTQLLLRTEQRFQVKLPSELLSHLETPQDLLDALVKANPDAAVFNRAEVEDFQLSEISTRPDQVQTLAEAFLWHVERQADRPHIYLYGDQDQAQPISYGQQYAGACQIAAGLLAGGIEPGMRVAIMLPTGRDYFDSFLGILLVGAIPVPIYPPLRFSQLAGHLQRHAGILINAGAALLITFAEAKGLAKLLKALVPGLRDVCMAKELRVADQELAHATLTGSSQGSDTAFLQYTSGSTGAPKGVILSHANLLANIRAMGQAVQVQPSDVFVSWLPLYHDMGLIASWLSSLYFAIPLVSMSPLQFLSHPQRWLWMIHRHRGTLSASPNFGYELCLRNFSEQQFDGLDLSSWRAAFNGAEPVSPSTIRCFTERFGHYGFRAETMVPVYGLAESSVGLTVPPLGRKPYIDRVKRKALMGLGEASPADASDSEALEFPDVGRPLPDHQIRIVDEAERPLAERREGRVEFCGPSSTSGYFDSPEATGRLFKQGWLDTGDRGYLADGHLFITGRSKDIIIRAGRNLYPHELEEAVGNLEGIRKGCVAVFAVSVVHSDKEQLVVLAETRIQDHGIRARLRSKIAELAVELLETPPDDIVLAAPHAVLKTSSGKVRRAACRQRYEQGAMWEGDASQWRQWAELLISSVWPRLRRVINQTVDMAYSLYSGLLLGLFIPVVCLLITLREPGLQSWSLIRWWGRLWLRLTATSVDFTGLENLPEGACVMVANHGSYLDGMVLSCVLPKAYRFVAKQELRNNAISRMFLSRLNTAFVERFDSEQGVKNVVDLTEQARQGSSLLFFPEGTFSARPGLNLFHMGAFTVAAESGLPVVPITLKGFRYKLPAGSHWPRRGALSIRISAAIYPEGDDWSAAVALRDSCRQEMLKYCSEPDLSGSGFAVPPRAGE
jgi:acyl carrier protein